MKFLKFLPKIIQVAKILWGAYKAGHEAGLWTEGRGLDSATKSVLIFPKQDF